MITADTKPKDKSEIHEMGPYLAWGGMRHKWGEEALRHGKHFFHFEGEKSIWFVDDKGEINTLFFHYDSVPGNSSFEEKVMEFVLDPKRSNRQELMDLLVGRKFFHPSADQVKIINDILKTDLFCLDGRMRFREHMGDLLPPEKLKSKKILLELEIFDNGQNSGNYRTYNHEHIPGDISKRLEDMDYPGNFYSGFKIKLVD